MKQFLADLIKRLTSRKFLLTVASAATLSANKEYAAAAGVVATYILAEGGADVAQRYQAERTKQANAVLEDTRIQYGEVPGGGGSPDRSEIVSGAEVPSEGK